MQETVLCKEHLSCADVYGDACLVSCKISTALYPHVLTWEICFSSEESDVHQVVSSWHTVSALRPSLHFVASLSVVCVFVAAGCGCPSFLAAFVVGGLYFFHGPYVSCGPVSGCILRHCLVHAALPIMGGVHCSYMELEGFHVN